MKKRAMAALLIVSTLFSLTACGTADTQSQTVTEAKVTEAKVTETKVVEESNDEEITIRVALFEYTTAGYFSKIVEGFEATHPNIKVEAVDIPTSDYDNLLQVKLSSKENFDVVFTKSTPALSGLIAKGHVLPLNDYITQSGLDTSFYGGLIEQMGLNGETYAVPFRKDNFLLFYNKDLFDEAGVEYPEDGMTMDEYYEMAKSVTSGVGNEKVYGTYLHTWANCVYMLPRRLNEWSYLDDSMDALQPYYEYYLKMMDEGLIMNYGELKATNTHYSGVMYNQQVASLGMGTWLINMLVENATFNWGVAAMPNMSGVGNTQAAGGVTPVSIGAYGEHPEAAWEFVQYATGEESAKILAESGIIPGYSSDAVNSIFDAIPETNEFAPEKLSQYIDFDSYIVQEPIDELGRELSSVVDEEHDLIMTNSKSIEEGLREIERRQSEIKNK